MQVHSTGVCRLWVAFPELITTPATPAGYTYLVGVGPVFTSGTPATTSVGFGAPQPFGTCERFPAIVESPEYEEWFTDRGGFKKPDDLIFAGKDAIVGGVLTRYRESIYRRLAETPGYAGQGTRSDFNSDVGTMMIRERRHVILWVQFDYGGGGPLPLAFPTSKPVHVAGSMPGGYRFPGAIWRGPNRHSPGTGAKKIQFLFHCTRVLNPDFGFYSSATEDMSALVGLQWDVTP